MSRIYQVFLCVTVILKSAHLIKMALGTTDNIIGTHSDIQAIVAYIGAVPATATFTNRVNI